MVLDHHWHAACRPPCARRPGRNKRTGSAGPPRLTPGPLAVHPVARRGGGSAELAVTSSRHASHLARETCLQVCAGQRAARTVSAAVRAIGRLGARAYGHIADSVVVANPHPVMFAQIRRGMEGQAGACCKTVGSAYVGSNPTPATSFRRSEPVTLDCVTGFSRERERLRRPSAVPRGPYVGRIRWLEATVNEAA